MRSRLYITVALLRVNCYQIKTTVRHDQPSNFFQDNSSSSSSSSLRMAEETGTIAPGRLKYGQQKTSFSDTLNKFKTNTSTRRRTATDLITSTFTSSASSYTKIAPQQEQPQPPPHQSVQTRIPRSSSFFNSLNTFVPRGGTSHKIKEFDIKEPNHVKQPRKITNRFPPTTSFFNSVPSHQDGTEPLIPKRKSNTQITQRALMQPISNPPLPRRSTMGNLTQKPSTQIPSFMRPTSSSSARRNSGPGLTKNHAPTKTATPNKPRSRPSGQIPLPLNFSLPSASRLPTGTVQPSTTPVRSPKFGFEQSEKSKRPKLDINSKLTFDELLRSITPEEETEKVGEKPPTIEETSDEPTTPESPFVPNPAEVCLLAPMYLIRSLSIPLIFAESLLDLSHTFTLVTTDAPACHRSQPRNQMPTGPAA